MNFYDKVLSLKSAEEEALGVIVGYEEIILNYMSLSKRIGEGEEVVLNDLARSAQRMADSLRDEIERMMGSIWDRVDRILDVYYKEVSVDSTLRSRDNIRQLIKEQLDEQKNN